MHRSSVGFQHRLLAGTLFAAALTWCSAWACTALACGGGYGGDVDIDPQQSVAVGFRDGIETYVFAPRFCGAPADFGLVLPIAGALDGQPTLIEGDLFGELDSITAPSVTTTKMCRPDDDSKGISRGGAPNGDDEDVEIVHSGTVDIFDWVELTADDSSALTAWLDEHEFAYDSTAKTAFDRYVEQGFRFVAFKVSAGANAVLRDAGSDDPPCGTFGPVSVRFATKKPVVPLRISVAHHDAIWREFAWNVFVVAEQQMRAESQESGVLQAALRYSGDVGARDLERSASLAAIARRGDRLTRLRLEFSAELEDDLWLVPSKTSVNYRAEKETVEFVDCNGCSVGGGNDPRAAGSFFTALMLGLVLRARSRSRRLR